MLKIISGKVVSGANVQVGKNVVVNVAEELVLGDRCVIGDNAYFEGRRIEIQEDFFNYSWEWKRLDIGRGRRDEEDAILTVGSRCTFHDNRIDLARRVTIGDDVGLSPEVCIYTHYYWQSPLEGYPMRYGPVQIDNGVIVGFRSTILPGVRIEHHAVIGAHSVVTKNLYCRGVYGGNPAKPLASNAKDGAKAEQIELLGAIVDEYNRSCAYRGLHVSCVADYPFIRFSGGGESVVDVTDGKIMACRGEDCYTDDLRWFLFTRGIKIYSTRPFRKLGRKV